jgi:hypothetical protein
MEIYDSGRVVNRAEWLRFVTGASPEYRAARACSAAFYRAICVVRAVVAGLHVSPKRLATAEQELGISVAGFIAHIEAQFTPDLTWENYASVWNNDHIIPQSHFETSYLVERRRCNHFTNIRPRLAKLNTRLGARVKFRLLS